MTRNPRALTVDGVLHRSAVRTPDRTALIFADRTWTYRELDAAVSRAAAWLLAQGLSRGDRVAAFGTNSDAYVIGFLACARAGLVHVPINYALRGDELAYLLNRTTVGAVLVDPALDDPLRAVGDDRRILPLRDAPGSLLDAARAESAPVAADGVAEASDLAQLLFTSGTTSKPKAAMMSHGALVSEYTSCILALDLTADDRPLICMPLYHSAAMHVFMLPYLAIGATITLLPSPDIAEVLRHVEEDRIGSLFLAPTVWVPLAGHPDLDRRDLSSLTKVQYGASIMPVTVLQRLRERYPDLAFYNCFGQSEVAPLATVLRPEDHEDRPASCGRPVFYVETRVVDEHGQDVADGEPGEILYRSPQLCDGYWDDEAATADAFAGGWFHSGDLVTRDAEGFITVVDRIKDVINTGGIMVASREVEDAIYTHPAVAEVAVIGAPDERWIEAITAFVVLRDGQQADAAEITGHVRERLASFKVPKRVKFIEELPRNQSGKLLKRELRTRV
jgi:fatty-acyl-CoA synthase